MNDKKKKKSIDIHIGLSQWDSWDWCMLLMWILAIGLCVILILLFVDTALAKTTSKGPFQAVVESTDIDKRIHTHYVSGKPQISTDTKYIVTFEDDRTFEVCDVKWFKSIKEDDIITYYIHNSESPIFHIKEEFIDDEG